MKRQQNPGEMSRQPAFWLACDGISLVRLNLVGREARGVVRSREEYRCYLDALAAELSALANADSGEPVVERMFRADQQVDPLTVGSASDLIVWWSRARPILAVQSSALGTISGRFTDDRSGEHIMRGMFLLSHPRTRRGLHVIEGMSALDIAATLCDLAGVQPETRLEGTSRVRNLLAG